MNEVLSQLHARKSVPGLSGPAHFPLEARRAIGGGLRRPHGGEPSSSIPF